MRLQMIRYGLLCGFTFLLTVSVLDWLARPIGAAAPAAGEGDITEQVWAVLAEARRILEESA